MFSASVAESHRFGRVRRNGYDPREVDAVVARLVEILRSSDARASNLEARLAEADVSADAIRRTFVSAEITKGKILSEAALEAEKSLVAAHQEATEISELAESLNIAVASERERLLKEAQAEAETIAQEAEAAAAGRTAGTSEQANELLRAATRAAADRSNEAAATRHAASIASAWITRRARENARSTIAQAEARAEITLRNATIEAETIREKISSLRAAVESLQSAASNLATHTAENASAIAMDAVEVLGSVDCAATAIHGTEAFKPLLSVAEAREELELETEKPELLSLRRQTTGTRLSDRIRIARMSG